MTWQTRSTEWNYWTLPSSEDIADAFFEKYFKKMGFSEIKKGTPNRTPDYIAIRNSKQVKVEIEGFSSSFISHKHKREDVDVVVCLIKDVELPNIEVLSIIDLFGWEPIGHKLRMRIDKKYYENSPENQKALRDSINMM